jgi:hypothetical protein
LPALACLCKDLQIIGKAGQVGIWVRFFGRIFTFFAFLIDGQGFMHFSIWVRFTFFGG